MKLVSDEGISIDGSAISMAVDREVGRGGTTRDRGNLVAEKAKVGRGGMRAGVSYVAAVLLALLGEAAAGELVIGRWCDRVLPAMPQYNTVLEIVVGEDGEVQLRSRLGEAVRAEPLREGANGLFFATRGSSGDKYRVVSRTGDLQLLDADGLIRVARRLENTPRRGECSHD
jgi:hypothetical protein